MKSRFDASIGWSLVAGLGALPIAFGLTSSEFLATFAVLFVAAMTWYSRSAAAPYVALALISGFVAFLRPVLIKLGIVTLDNRIVVAVFVAGALALSRYWHTRCNLRITPHEALVIAIPSLTSGLFLRAYTWDPIYSFGRLSVTGEDVGAWLDGTAKTLLSGGNVSVLNPHNGGTTNAFITSLASTFYRISSPMGSTTVESAVLLLRMNWILISVAVTLASLIVVSLSRAESSPVLWLAGSTTGFLVLPFGVSLLTIGHFTALVAAVMMMCGILCCIMLDRAGNSTKKAQVVQVGIAGIAVAEAWYPLNALIVASALVAGLLWLSKQEGESWFRYWNLVRNLKRPVLIVLLLAIGVCIIVGRNLQIVQFLKNGIDFDYVKFNFGLGGGYAPVDFTFAFLILGAACLLTFEWSRRHNCLSLSVVITGLVFLAALFVVFNSLIPPYSPSYGALKTVHLATMVTIPVLIGSLLAFPIRLDKFRWHLGISVVPILVFITQWAPLPQIADLVKPSSVKPWAAVAVQQIENEPDRKLLCLDTRETQDWDGYEAYSCSRLLAGLQGIAGYEANVWTAGNICQISSAQLDETIPKSFYDDFTILVFDARRLSSGHACTSFGWAGNEDWGIAPNDPKWKLGWLTGVDWSKVKVVDLDGRNVTKSFDYLKWNDYDAETIASLNSTLALP